MADQGTLWMALPLHKLAMVSATKRYSEFVTDFAAEGALLRVTMPILIATQASALPGGVQDKGMLSSAFA
jgi:hypothetical protein